MEVPGFAGIEILPVSEDVPAERADIPAVRLFEVDVGKLHSWIGDEDSSQPLFNVLEISTSTEIVEARRKSTRCSSCDVIAGSKASVGVNFCFKDANLFSKVSKRKDMCNDRLGKEVDLKSFKCVTVDSPSHLSPVVSLADLGES
jgi:hypothetical protein